MIDWECGIHAQLLSGIPGDLRLLATQAVATPMSKPYLVSGISKYEWMMCMGADIAIPQTEKHSNNVKL